MNRSTESHQPTSDAELVDRLLERQDSVLQELDCLNVRIESFIEELNQARQERAGENILPMTMQAKTTPDSNRRAA